jgi:Protein of unknown function (DUF3277)
MGDLKIYDASEVSLIFAGIPISSGYAEGEFCKVERKEEGFSSVVGTDGEVTRSKTNNRMAKVTIRLMQSSSANAALTAIHNADLYTSNGAGVAPILIKDRQGTSLHSGAKAWIVKSPDASYDKTAKEREWEFEVADMFIFSGGN